MKKFFSHPASLRHTFFLFSLLACFLAFTVIVLGAYTRLKDAGLGCPDWPGCYGQLSVPTKIVDIEKAQHLYPALKVEAQKAWPEMIHRYFAGTLGTLIFFLSGALLFYRKTLRVSVFVPLGLVSLVIFQALLGMWTVTWLLHPLVVMGHLLGGIIILSLLVWSTLHWYRYEKTFPFSNSVSCRDLVWAWIGLVIIFLQIALGGWTASNYAALVCPDFPQCSAAHWIPILDIKHAFDFTSPIGANYEGGLLHYDARATIQFFHRIGALITFLYILAFSIRLISKHTHPLRSYAFLLLFVLILQIILGILNVVWVLPLTIAMSHNAVGVILLITMLFIVYQFHSARKNNLLAPKEMSNV